MRYPLSRGLSTLLLYLPSLTLFLILLTIFIVGTIFIYNSFLNQLQNLSAEKTSDKYKIIKGFIQCFVIIIIILFYAVDTLAILFYSYAIYGEIKTMNDPNPLPSSLNIGIETVLLYLIIWSVPFVAVTTVLIIKNRKKIKSLKNKNPTKKSI